MRTLITKLCISWYWLVLDGRNIQIALMQGTIHEGHVLTLIIVNTIVFALCAWDFIDSLRKHRKEKEFIER